MEQQQHSGDKGKSKTQNSNTAAAVAAYKVLDEVEKSCGES